MRDVNGDSLAALRHALQGEYRIERTLAGTDGLMRVVAWDLGLERQVEIAALAQMEAPQVEAFLAGARLLARVNHPGVVAVHRANTRFGVHYIALEHLEGEILASRLERGPLDSPAAIRLGQDLLRALEASHAAGVVHPGLECDAVAALDDRAVIVGLRGAPADERGVAADLAAVAAILYLAASGRAWNPAAAADPATWRGLPMWLRGVLRRALSPHPSERFRDAAAFRRALDRLPALRPRHGLSKAAGYLGLMGLGAGIWVAGAAVRHWLASPPIGGEPRELAVLPLDVVGERGSDTVGVEVAHLVQLTLDNVPGLELTSPRRVLRWWERQAREVGGAQAEAARALNAHWVAHGQLARRGDSVRVRLTLYDSSGGRTPLPEVRGSLEDFGGLGEQLALQLLRTVAPDLEPLYRPLPEIADVPVGALKAFLHGEAAFARDAWTRAERSYAAAVELDSSFALAWWRLANVKRVRRQPYEFDLRTFYARHGDRLRPTDRAAIEALLEPNVERRLAMLEAAVAGAPKDANTRFLYAEELWHRGPLVGRPVEAAARAMDEAIALDSSLAEAYNHLFALELRAGHRAEARRLLDLRRRVSLRPETGDADVVALLELAYDERFVPWRAALKRRLVEWEGDSTRLADLARVSRLGAPWFDLPATQVALTGILERRRSAGDSARASALTGAALGLMALGRPDAALMRLDSAVALFPTAEARLQQAEWRVVPRLVGLPPTNDAGDTVWRARLEDLARDTVVGARARWLLALDRLAEGHGAELSPDGPPPVADGVPALDALHRAVAAGARGAPATALAISDSIRPRLAVNQPPDPFAGALFHLLRGDWYAARGDARSAEREWRWHEGSDFEGWPSATAQAGEIEAAFGVYARAKRAGLRLSAGASASDTAAACALLSRVAELWRSAEPSMAAVRGAALRRMDACPR